VRLFGESVDSATATPKWWLLRANVTLLDLS
jgi:hypothetical protein